MAIEAKFIANFDQFTAATKTADAALDKLAGTGAVVEKRFADVGTAADIAAPKVGTLKTSLNQFDGVLSAMGVHIGPEIRALGELGEAAGKSGTEIGLLGVAGLAAGAALGGWKLGRLAADFFDLDTKIANATAKFLGWGDATGQAALARQDTINAAIARGAPATITFSDAMAWNTTKVNEQRTALVAGAAAIKQHAIDTEKAAAEAAKWAAITGDLVIAGQPWQVTLDQINGSVVEAIKFYLAAGVAQNQLATAYGLSASQIKAVAASLADELAAAKSLMEFEDLAAKREFEIRNLQTQATNNAIIERLKERQAGDAANAAFLSGALAAAQAQDLLNNTVRATTQSYWQQVDAAAAAAGVTVVGHRAGEGPGINGAPPSGGFSLGGAFSLGPSTFAPPVISSHAAGGPVHAGLAMLHDDEYVVPKGGALVSRGGGGPNITIYVNGTAEEAGRKIAAYLQRSMMQGKKLAS